MKKLLKLITCAAVVLSPLTIGNFEKVHADDEYAMACNAYEVDTINDDGSLQVVDCYDDFSDAKTAMSQNGADTVVRHGNSKSPSKIIAMNKNGGVGYAYTERNGGGLLYIYGIGTSASTYMQSDRELYYVDTLSYNGDGTGTVEVEVRGFHGTVELEDIDLVPTKYAANDLEMTLGDGSIRNVMNSSFYQVEQNGAYKDLVLYAYDNNNNIIFHRAVGPAADWMNVNAVYYSSDDVNFYWDTYHTNYAGTYYNYYQFVPLRSQSSISVDAYNSYLSSKGYGSSSALWNTGGYFVDDQNVYGMNAAMVFAQAICESGYGMSNLSKRNNLFGVNAVDSNPNAAYSYSSVKAAIDYQTSYLLRRYSDDANSLFYGPAFGNKGTGITVKYASNIYYGATLAAIYYDFDKFSNGYNGSLTDSTDKTVGIMNSTDGVYTRSDGSDIYQYNYQNNNGYQNDAAVLILGEEGDYYKIQSINYLNDDGTKKMISGRNTPEWNWDAFVGYVHKNSVDLVNGSAPIPSSDTQQDEDAKENDETVPSIPDDKVNDEQPSAQETSESDQPQATENPSTQDDSLIINDDQEEVMEPTENNNGGTDDIEQDINSDHDNENPENITDADNNKVEAEGIEDESIQESDANDSDDILEVLVDGNPINKDSDYTVNDEGKVALTETYSKGLNDSQHTLEVRKKNSSETTLINEVNENDLNNSSKSVNPEENISQASKPEADISVNQTDIEQNKKQDDNSPQTGDRFKGRLYELLIIVALMDAALVLTYMKTRKVG